MDANEMLRLMRLHARFAVELADEADSLVSVPDALMMEWGTELDKALGYACELDRWMSAGRRRPAAWRAPWVWY